MATTTTFLLFFFSLLLSITTLSTACGGNPKCPLPSPKPKPKPTPKPCPSPPKPAGNCPIDTLKLGVCAGVLNLMNVVIGTPPSGSKRCCALIDGLVDAEALLCLCTAIKANVLGVIKLDVPVALSLLLGYCHKSIPPGFTCP